MTDIFLLTIALLIAMSLGVAILANSIKSRGK